MKEKISRNGPELIRARTSSQASKRMRELIQRERQFKSITQTASDAIITINGYGKVIFWNKAATRMFGYTAAEMKALDITTLMPESYRKKHEQGMSRFLETRRPMIIGKTVELEGLRKSGVVFPIELSLSRWQRENQLYFTGIIRDITRRKALEDRLQRSHEDLELIVQRRTNELRKAHKALQKEYQHYQEAEKARMAAELRLHEQKALSMRSDRLRSLGEMAAGIAHELYQPLVGVRGLAEHLLIGMDRGWEFDDSAVREKLALIIEQADRMTHIIEHVRIFAKQAGKPEMHHVHANDVVLSTIEMVRAQLVSSEITLASNLTRQTDGIMANPFSLEEVLLNLLFNARDAIEQKRKQKNNSAGSIRIRTALESAADRKNVLIEIRDSGIGIPKSVQARVFEPFFSAKESERATGLGLAISRAIIELLGGTIGIKSRFGHGTTVTITLPNVERSDSASLV